MALINPFIMNPLLFKETPELVSKSASGIF
jgi:hypothetical protein